MSNALGTNLGAAFDNGLVDKLNSEFYGKIKYPGPVYSLSRVVPDNLWARMISHDVGYFERDVLPERPKIWIAGCGRNQALITALKFPQAEVLGSDLSEESLADCRRNAESLKVKNLELRRESLNEVQYLEQFDYVLCTGVVHHNADPSVPMQALVKAMKPEGILEAMVYNTYHRFHTAAFQEAVRRLVGNRASPNLELEFPVAQKLAKSFTAACQMNSFLGEYREPDCRHAYFCDALLQPVEHSYSVASLAELIAGAGLEFLTFAIDQFSQMRGAINWNLDLADPELRERYFSLPDAERWLIANLMLQEASPMLWFYFQRKDCPRPRKSEAQIAKDFLSTRFTRIKGTRTIYALNPEGTYPSGGRTLPFPPPLLSGVAKQVYDALDDSAPIGQSIGRLGIDTSFATIHPLRCNLATSAFPFIQAI